MELKEFITNTVVQIAEGVQQAIKQSGNKGYLVNPSQTNVGATYCIHFDLSVETGKEGNANIKILNGGISERSCNRVVFDVNMTYPTSGTTTPLKRPDYSE